MIEKWRYSFVSSDQALSAIIRMQWQFFSNFEQDLDATLKHLSILDDEWRAATESVIADTLGVS